MNIQSLNCHWSVLLDQILFNLTDKRKRRWKEGWGGGDYSREAIIFNISIKGEHFDIRGRRLMEGRLLFKEIRYLSHYHEILFVLNFYWGYDLGTSYLEWGCLYSNGYLERVYLGWTTVHPALLVENGLKSRPEWSAQSRLMVWSCWLLWPYLNSVGCWCSTTALVLELHPVFLSIKKKQTMLFQAKEPCVVWGNQLSCPKDISPKIRLSKTRVILTEMLIYVVQSFNISRDITLVLFDITSVENDFQATWQYTGVRPFISSKGCLGKGLLIWPKAVSVSFCGNVFLLW